MSSAHASQQQSSRGTAQSVSEHRTNSSLSGSGSGNVVNPLTNTTTNPLANLFSVGPYILSSSSSVMSTNRRSGSVSSSGSVNNRRTSTTSGVVDSSSTDALLEVSSSDANRRTSITANAAGDGAAANNDASPNTSGSGRVWNNINSVVQSIPPLVPTSALQRAARRIIGPHHFRTGNRRTGSGGAGSRASAAGSSSVESSTLEVDDLLGLLAAMEESVAESSSSNATEATNNRADPSTSNTESNIVGSRSLPSVTKEGQVLSAACSAASDITSSSNINSSNHKDTTINNETTKLVKEENSKDSLPVASSEADEGGSGAVSEVRQRTAAATSVDGADERTGTDAAATSAGDSGNNVASTGESGNNSSSNADRTATENNEQNTNNDESEETDNTDDPYWSGVLWQVPVLCLVLLCKFLQYYMSALMEVITIAFLFHVFNVVVKRNVVSNRAITIGWKQCCGKIIDNFKRNLRCAFRRSRRSSTMRLRVPVPLPTEERGAGNNGGEQDNSVVTVPPASSTSAVTNMPSEAHEQTGLSNTEEHSQANPNVPAQNSDISQVHSSKSDNKEEQSEDNKSDSNDAITDKNGGRKSSVTGEGSSQSNTDAVGASDPANSEASLAFIDLSKENTNEKNVGVLFFNDKEEEEEDNNTCIVQINPNYKEDYSESGNNKADKATHEGDSEASTSNEVPAGSNESADKPECQTKSEEEKKKSDCVVIDISSDVSGAPVTDDIVVSNEAGSAQQPSTERGEGDAAASSTAASAPPQPTLPHHPLLEALANLSEEDQQAQESVQCVLERSQLILITFVLCPFIVFLFYGVFWHQQAIYYSLAFLPPGAPPIYLTDVLWLCLMLDFLARLGTVWVKALVCLCLMARSSTSFLSKGKYYPVMEMVSQLYRSLLPIHPWFIYIYASHDSYNKTQPVTYKVRFPATPHTTTTTAVPDITPSSSPLEVFIATTMASVIEASGAGGEEPHDSALTEPIHIIQQESVSTTASATATTAHQLIGLALFVAYLLHKKLDLVARGSNLWQAIKTLKNNSGSYGTEPSKSELESSGGKCPICHDQFKVPTLLQCSHIFCEACIVQWFQRERICPMCRAQIADDPMWKDGATSQMPQII